MEAEVNALMGAVDEALWCRAGLFTLIDELKINAGQNSSRRANLGHSSMLSLTNLSA